MNPCILALRQHPVLIAATIVILAGFLGHFPVVWFLQLTGFLRRHPAGQPNFALWIGILERIAIAALLAMGSLTSAMFVFGLKTGVMALRFNEPEGRRETIEYVLLGTLVSFLVALPFGLAARWILRPG